MKTHFAFKSAIKPLLFLGVMIAFSEKSQAGDYSIITAIENDSVYRGISLSEEKPSLQFLIDSNFENGFFAGMNLTRHEASGYFNRQGWQTIYAGYFKKLSSDRAIETLISQYAFDADFARSWDYLELKSNYYLSQTMRFSITVADSYYGREFSSYYAEFSWQPRVSEGWYATLNFGNTFTPGLDYAESIANYALGISHNQNSWQYSITYAYVDSSAQYIHGENTTGGRLVFNVSYRFF